MKVAIANDTAILESKDGNTHFGCRMVMAAYHQLLAFRDIEVVGNPDKADLVLVNGEGSIHDDESIDLLELAERWPCVLMNCVFQDISPAYSHLLQNFKHITVRESMSANYMETHGYKPEIVPDLIFSYTLPSFTAKKRDDLFISDACRSSSYEVGYRSFLVRDPRYVEKMSTYRHACCGRFHSICIAAMLNMLFSAYSSNTWKNKSLMADMGVPELYADSQEDAMKIVPYVCPDSVKRYVSDAKVKINSLFDRLRDI